MNIRLETRMRGLVPLLLAAFVLAGCQAVPQPPPGVDRTHPAPAVPDTRPEGVTYAITDASEVRIVIFAAGELAHLGHPHVLAGAPVSGRVVVAEPFADSWLEASLPVAELEADVPAWRVDEGFEPEIDPDDIRATIENMRSEAVLDAENHPTVRLESVGLRGPVWQPDLDLHITLRGTTRALTVPVVLELDDDRLVASGRLLLRQSEFGIEPFSALGGALRVADEFLVRFRIEAERRFANAD